MPEREMNIERFARLSEGQAEIKGMLQGFITRFDRHEITDAEVARAADNRAERMENRFEARNAESFNKLDAKLDKIETELGTQIASLSTQLGEVTNRQSFAAGGWKYLSLAVLALFSLVTSVGDAVLRWTGH